MGVGASSTEAWDGAAVLGSWLTCGGTSNGETLGGRAGASETARGPEEPHGPKGGQDPQKPPRPPRATRGTGPPSTTDRGTSPNRPESLPFCLSASPSPAQVERARTVETEPKRSPRPTESAEAGGGTRQEVVQPTAAETGGESRTGPNAEPTIERTVVMTIFCLRGGPQTGGSEGVFRLSPTQSPSRGAQNGREEEKET